jgi:hypothetical protein
MTWYLSVPVYCHSGLEPICTCLPRMTQWLGTCLYLSTEDDTVAWHLSVPVYCEDDTMAWYLSCEDTAVTWYLSLPVYCEDNTMAWYLSVPIL